MRTLATMLSTAIFSAMLCSAATAQDAAAQDTDDALKLEAIPTNTIETQATPTLKEATDQPDADEKNSDLKEDEAVKLYRSLIFSVRTNNGFTIHGIPTKPAILPVSLFGAEAKIPWTSIRNLRFGADGNVSLELDDGSKLNGFTAVQRIVLDKDWGSVTVFRDKLDSISRSTQRTSTKQASFRTPGVPFSVTGQRNASQLRTTTQQGVIQQQRGLIQQRRP